MLGTRDEFSLRTLNRPVFRLPMLLVAAWLATTAMAAGTAGGEEVTKPPRLFSSDDTLVLTISAPWRDFMRKANYQGTYPAQIRYRNADGTAVELEATVERRGVKRQELCDFPPVRLRFDKKVVKGTTFRGQDSLKMVTHCDRSSKYDQYYILEMLAYRMYNLLTDYSFRVRPLEVTYVDSERDRTEGTRFAFLIEDDSDVAKRNHLKKIRVPKVKPRQLDPQMSSLMSLYQYMIGNVDWAALRGPDPNECCHNMKLIGPEPLGDDDFVIAVPYDFDSAGLIDAPYAMPPDKLPIKRVTQRLYRGLCRHNGTLEAARQEILAKEAAILGLISGDERLNASTKRKAGRFLEYFFEIARDPGDFDKYVVSECRG